MNELQEKIAAIRIKRTIKNIAKKQVGTIDFVNIVKWQMRHENPNISVSDCVLTFHIVKELN